MLLIPALREERQVDLCELKDSLGYIVRSRIARVSDTLNQKSKTRQNKKVTSDDISI